MWLFGLFGKDPKQIRKERERSNPTANLAAGFLGGFFDVMLHQPFDTVKVRMQSMPIVKNGHKPLYRNSFDCFYQTLSKEGMRGLYRGLTIVVLSDVPLSAIYFFGASIGKRLQQKNPDDLVQRISHYFWAGCLGGAMTAGIVTPVDRIKVLLQVQTSDRFGPVHIGRRLWKTGGLKTFYRGTLATLLRDIPTGGVYLATYEWVKRYLKSLRKQSQTSFSFFPTITAGGVAGLATCIIGMPPDVLKSQLQTAPDGKYPHGMRSVLKEILRKEGPLALYRGFGPVALYAFPGSAACMLGFELAMDLWMKSKFD